MKKRKKPNYLEFIPERNPSLPWSQDFRGIVTVIVTHKGLAAKIAQMAFGRPRISNIQMDRFGSYIWTQIDGEQNIYEIGMQVQREFGKDAEPLFERLIAFFRILDENEYITYKK